MSLAGTSAEARAGLLHFVAAAFEGCHAVGPDQTRCGRYSPWRVTCESAHSGYTWNGFFTPGTTYAHLCDEHVAQVCAEPRRVFAVEPARFAGGGSFTVVNVSAVGEPSAADVAAAMLAPDSLPDSAS